MKVNKSETFIFISKALQFLRQKCVNMAELCVVHIFLNSFSHFVPAVTQCRRGLGLLFFYGDMW